MKTSSDIARKGSILPMVLELEAELIERDNQLKKKTDAELEAAKQAAGQRISEAQNDLPGIEAGEREKLLTKVNASVEQRSGEEDKKLQNLEKAIERNRQKAIDHIMKQVLPDC